LAGVEGLEPPTPGFGDQCSSHLSYTPIATILSRINFVANVKIVKNKKLVKKIPKSLEKT
jgi:hypothetical protein